MIKHPIHKSQFGKRLLVLFCLLISIISTEAQTAFWKSSNESYFVGDYFVASLIIVGSDVKKQPKLASSEAFSYQLLEKKKVETEDQTTTIFRYKFIPVKAGSLLLPQATIGNIKTDNFPLIVQAPERNPNLRLEVTVSENSCFQFQPITLYFNWQSAIPLNNLKAVNIDLPIYKNKYFKVYTPSKTAQFSKHDISLPVSGKRIIASIHDVDINNTPYKGIEFQLTIVPQQAGIFEIEPSTVLCSYLKQNTSFNAYPAYFDNNLFDTETSNKYKRLVCQSKTIKLHVKELPRKNKPANFSGLFGAFNAEANLSEAQIEAGEALKMQFKIKDYPFPETFTLPELNTLLNNDFSFTKANPVVSYNDSLITIDKLIRINSVKTKALPEIHIPYFDLSKNSYAFINTNAIDIQVLPNKANASDIADSTQNAVKKNALTSNPYGILQLYTQKDALKQQKQKGNHWFWWSLILFPIVIFLGNKAYVSFTSQSATQKRNIRKATRVFNKSPRNTIEETQNAIQIFFQDAFAVTDEVLLPNKITEVCSFYSVNIDLKPIKEFYAVYFSNSFSQSDKSTLADTEEIKICINKLAKICLQK